MARILAGLLDISQQPGLLTPTGQHISCANMSSRKRTLTDADKRATAKLRALWADYKKKNPGISQEAAAAKVGITQSALSQFLLGTVPMRLSPVLKLAQLFGVDPTAIRDDLQPMSYVAGTPSQLKAAEPSTFSSEALEIARIFDQLEPQTKNLIREQVFIYSVIDKKYPWLRRGRPIGKSYAAFEKWHEANIETMVDLAAQRHHKTKA